MLILGHRGVINPSVSENSLAAFKAALEVADGFETDACLTADGEVFLIHEANDASGIRAHLDNISTARAGARRLRQIDAAEITMLRLSDGQPMPKLGEALRLVGQQPGKGINIELKSYGVEEEVIATLREAFEAGTIKPESVLVSSFHHAALKPVRAALPDVALGALVVADDENGKPLYSYDGFNAAKDGRYAGLTQTLQSPLIAAIAPDFFVMPEKMLKPETVAQVTAAFGKALLGGWTVTERADYDQKDLLDRLATLKPTGKVGAMIVDDPAGFAKAWRGK